MPDIFANIWERDCPELAALEAYDEKIAKDPEWAAVFEESRGIYTDIVFELFRVVELRD